MHVEQLKQNGPVANSKRADDKNVEDLDKITFDYEQPKDENSFGLKITKNKQ